ncbi:MAG: MaoC/PaaZ C-terminal domain-containing protein [Betaproteobacteria bacterium]
MFGFETRDATDALVSQTRFGALYRGVTVEGPDRGTVEALPASMDGLQPMGVIEVAAHAAHVYTECARIWNPIHTDVAHARAAGLPDIILHGTATLALSISKAAREFDRVRRIQCRFTGMVLMPSTLTVQGARNGNVIAFETLGPKGESVIGSGRIALG